MLVTGALVTYSIWYRDMFVSSKCLYFDISIYWIFEIICENMLFFEAQFIYKCQYDPKIIIKPSDAPAFVKFYKYNAEASSVTQRWNVLVVGAMINVHTLKKKTVHEMKHHLPVDERGKLQRLPSPLLNIFGQELKTRNHIHNITRTHPFSTKEIYT